MSRENEFVEVALASARDVIEPPLSIERGKALLYRVTVDNRLKMTVNPNDPKRGQSAFETDLCVFETVGDDPARIPRVVLEFKQGLSTHDVLTYNAKVTRHKQGVPVPSLRSCHWQGAVSAGAILYAQQRHGLRRGRRLWPKPPPSVVR